MQHLTGPLLAKALEDTFFYRYNRLLALNEVGGDPLARDGSIGRFHFKMQERVLWQPNALTATSTHDTKRGEDARARLYAISEAPALWAAAVERWRDMHRHLILGLPDGPAPEPNVEWMLYQALAGVWPTGLDINDELQLSALSERFLAYVQKALREAKLRTDWTDNNLYYEQAVARYASAMLSADNTAFLHDFQTELRPFVEAGIRNSLTQTVLKLTVPGIPDIYQGCEGLDFSLADPDNRRAVDLLHAGHNGFARLKREVIAALLGIRRQRPQLFTTGRYVPIEVEGEASRHLIAFARIHAHDAAIVILQRLVFDFVRDGRISGSELWRGTQVILPQDLRSASFRNLATGEDFLVENGAISVDAAFAGQPFLILIASVTN
jgi:(1->4)-alpha-D-glucan 1-alpha-D-glucosylmutase